MATSSDVLSVFENVCELIAIYFIHLNFHRKVLILQQYTATLENDGVPSPSTLACYKRHTPATVLLLNLPFTCPSTFIVHAQCPPTSAFPLLQLATPFMLTVCLCAKSPHPCGSCSVVIQPFLGCFGMVNSVVSDHHQQKHVLSIHHVYMTYKGTGIQKRNVCPTKEMWNETVRKGVAP